MNTKHDWKNGDYSDEAYETLYNCLSSIDKTIKFIKIIITIVVIAIILAIIL